MSFSINKLLVVVLVALAVGIVLLFLFKVDITKYFKFLPDFDANKEDKFIGDPLFQGGSPGDKTGATKSFKINSLQEGETCCCLYEGAENTGECKGAKLELNQYCKDKLGNNWVNCDENYCEK